MKRRKFRRRLRGAYLIPNLLTTANLFCGFYSIMKSLNGEFSQAAWIILLAGLFDLLDGRIAKWTGGQTQFGIEYDSLVDLSSFGLAPALLVYIWSLKTLVPWGALVILIFFACGALRLARYNVQVWKEELVHFQGLPIPMAATMLATTVLFYDDIFSMPPRVYFWLAPLVAGLGILMITNIKYRGIKKFDFRTRASFPLLVAFALLLGLIATGPAIVLWGLSLLYICEGLVESLWRYCRHRGESNEAVPETSQEKTFMVVGGKEHSQRRPETVS